MMTSRIIISLKKFATERQTGHLGLEGPDVIPTNLRDEHHSRVVDGVQLCVLKGERVTSHWVCPSV